MNNKQLQTTAPGLLKLGACLLYEALTVIALSFVFTGIFLWFAGDATHGARRVLMQFFLWLVLGAYFIWCWLRSGRTLAMQVWRLKLLDEENQLLTMKLAAARYLLATLSLALCGLGFLWAVIDRDHLFLHDRLLKCKVVLQSK